MPAPYRREITLLFAKLDHLWLNFFKAEVVIGLLTGSVDFVVMWLWGMPGALPLAIIAGTIGLIPTIGGFLAAIPVVALTAHAMSGDRERAVGAGFHYYLTKPLSPRTFLEDLLKLFAERPATLSSVEG